MRLQKSMQHWLAPGFGAFRFDYNADRIDALAEERASEWKRIGDASFLSLDEQREAVGYGPAPKAAKFSAPDELRYAPDQPRDHIGRWTSGGGPGAATQTALNADPHVANDAGVNQTQTSSGRPVDILEHDARGGHTFERHISKSREYLIRRSESTRYSLGRTDNWEAFGSFASVEAANKLISSTLAQNQAIVDKVALGKNGNGLEAAIITSTFEQPTGYESYAPGYKAALNIRDAYSVKVVIRHDDRMPTSYLIVTSFPFNP